MQDVQYIMEADGGKHDIYARPTSQGGRLGSNGVGKRTRIKIGKKQRKGKQQQDNVTGAPDVKVNESNDDGFNNYSSTEKKNDFSHRKGGNETIRGLNDQSPSVREDFVFERD